MILIAGSGGFIGGHLAAALLRRGERVRAVDLKPTGLAAVRVPRRYELDAPKGVRGRSSDNTLIRERLGWTPSTPLAEGMRQTWAWVLNQVRQSRMQTVCWTR